MLYKTWTGRSTITAIKSPSFLVTTFSANLTHLTVLLPQSRDTLLRKQRNTSTPTGLIAEPHWHNAHTTSRTLPNSDISLGSLTSPAPKAGGFVELILLYVILAWQNSGCQQICKYVNTSNRKRRCFVTSRPATSSERTLQGWMTIAFNAWIEIWEWAAEGAPHQDRQTDRYTDWLTDWSTVSCYFTLR